MSINYQALSVGGCTLTESIPVASARNPCFYSLIEGIPWMYHPLTQLVNKLNRQTHSIYHRIADIFSKRVVIGGGRICRDVVDENGAVLSCCCCCCYCWEWGQSNGSRNLHNHSAYSINFNHSMLQVECYSWLCLASWLDSIRIDSLPQCVN